MDEKLTVCIDPDGTIRYVYDDRLAEVFAGEEQTTRRASHVEPHPTKNGWLADMRPSGGPVLGFGCELNVAPDEPEAIAFAGLLVPFPTRQAALDAERTWLREKEGL